MGKDKYVESVYAFSLADAKEKLSIRAGIGKLGQSYDKHTPNNKAKAFEFIENNVYYMEEGFLDYIDLGIEYYILQSIKKSKDTCKTKHQKRYIVEAIDSCGRILENYGSISCLDRKTASKKAFELATKNFIQYQVREGYEVVEGSDIKERYEITYKTLKKKPTSIKPGDKLSEVHQYIFYGMICN